MSKNKAAWTPGDVATIDGKRMPPEHRVDRVSGARAWLDEQLARGKNETFMVEQTLTAPLGRMLLDANPQNRTIYKATVDEYVRSMQAGEFDSTNGETIKVAKDGSLNDGQHRIEAAMKADVEQNFFFVFGLKRESRETLDQGKLRTTADYLTLADFQSGANAVVAGAAVMLWQWRTHNTISRSSSHRPGKSQAAAFAKQQWESLMASMAAVPTRGAHMFGGKNFLTFAHIVFAEVDFEAATDFIGALVNGNELDSASPILTLRNRYIRDVNLKRYERWELMIRAWNAWHEKRPLEKMQLMGAYPAIAGLEVKVIGKIRNK